MRTTTFYSFPPESESRPEIVELRNKHKENPTLTHEEKCIEETALIDVLYHRDLAIQLKGEADTTDNFHRCPDIAIKIRQMFDLYILLRLTTRRLLNDVGVPGVFDGDFDLGVTRRGLKKSNFDIYVEYLPKAHIKKTDGNTIMTCLRKYEVINPYGETHILNSQLKSFKKTLNKVRFESRKHAVFAMYNFWNSIQNGIPHEYDN